MSSGAAVVTLAMLGLWLIWKGLVRDILFDRFGEPLIPRWAYILGGLVLLVFPTLVVLVRTESGRSLLGW